ncbi:hypothetical protein AB0O76_10910 [Streptomyces sp. NPDC086554]|uniref:hypothetical protein n=1 Tax=Streptomyces sp. NPDC086554 TaxID=3154864 RepID=UPI00343E80A4
MTSRDEQRVIADRLGIQAEAAEWCTVGKIPTPPADVFQAAGSPRLRPGRMHPLEMVFEVLAAPFKLIFWLAELVTEAREAVLRTLDPGSEKERLRGKKAEAQRHEAFIVEQGLDRVFDGNWQGAAGQFLLHWYTHSTDDQRLVLITQDGIVLAAPPVRAVLSREKHTEVVARLAAEEAGLVDPFNWEFETRMLLLRFRDGSWLRIDTEDTHSDLHKYLLRQPLPEDN